MRCVEYEFLMAYYIFKFPFYLVVCVSLSIACLYDTKIKYLKMYNIALNIEFKNAILLIMLVQICTTKFESPDYKVDFEMNDALASETNENIHQLANNYLSSNTEYDYYQLIDEKVGSLNESPDYKVEFELSDAVASETNQDIYQVIPNPVNEQYQTVEEEVRFYICFQLLLLD